MAPENKSTFWDIIKFALITLVIVVPVRTYIAQPFIVSGASMDPTFKEGEYLIIDELSYLLRSPTRGEVVVFRYPKDPSKFFIKRVIGLPGETVAIDADGVKITAPGGKTIALDEPYVQTGYYPAVTRQLGEKEYFVMGDNRPASLDSRIWGPVTEDLIKGRAWLRLLPPTKIGVRPGQN